MFKEFKKEIRKNKLLTAATILLDECHELVDDFKINQNKIYYNNCVELKKIADSLFEYYEKNE